MHVSYDEGVAIHIGPESCALAREGLSEALTGVRIGQPLSRDPLPRLIDRKRKKDIDAPRPL